MAKLRRFAFLCAVVFVVALAVPVTALAIDEDGGSVLPESYQQLELATLADAGQLQLPDGVTAEAQSDGLVLSGTVEALNSGKIVLGNDLAFDADMPVGRISVNGLAGPDVAATVNVFLDDAKEPVANLSLDSQTDAEWIASRYITQDAYGKIAAGEHHVSIGLAVTGTDNATEAQVYLKSIVFARMTLPVLYFNPDEIVPSEPEGRYGTVEEMNASEDHSIWCRGSVDITVPTGYTNEFGGATQGSYENLALEMRGRGNSTWTNDNKRPYRLKFDKKQNLFGMGANKHWVLLANTYDSTMLQNRLTLWLGREVGLDYTPKCVPVEVVVDGDYYGSYLLCEQVRVGENRVAIASSEDNPPENSGYLFSVEQYEEDAANLFSTTYGFDLQYVTPSPEDPDEVLDGYQIDEYLSYLREYVQKTEDAIFGLGFKDADGTSYTQYLDVDSTVKYWWIQNFTKNGDAFGTGSTYLYKKEDGKIYWGPLWDFDMAWGRGAETEREGDTDYLYGAKSTCWVDQLKGSARFRTKLMDFWDGVLYGKLSEMTAVGGVLDAFRDEVAVSWVYDQERWLEGEFSNTYGQGNASDPIGVDEIVEPAQEISIAAYVAEVEQLREWTDSMARMTDASMDDFCTPQHVVSFSVDDQVVSKLYVTGDMCLKTVPVIPDKDGFFTLGWLKEDGSTFDFENEIVRSDITLIAGYVSRDEAIQADGLYFSNYEPCITISSNQFIPKYTITPASAQAKEITWTCSDDTVAEVGADGQVRPISPGSVTITGTLEGGATASYVLTVLGEGETLNDPETIEVEESTLHVGVGKSSQVRVVLGPKPVWNADCGYLSSDPDVASVDENGVVTGLKEGTVEVTASLLTVDESGPSAVCTVVVSDEDSMSIEGAKLQISNAVFKYNGKVQRPTLKSVGKKKIKEGTDYTVIWSNAKSKNVGTYTLQVKGKGAYTGTSLKATYKIVKGKNTLVVKGKTVKVKKNALKKRAKKVGVKTAFKVTGKNVPGKVTYKKLKGNKKIKVASNGKVTIGKGLKKGTYKVKVRVKQKATKNYAGKKIEPVTFKVKVS